MAAWEWKGSCSPFRFISNITFSPHLQQVKVVGSLLAMRATYQYTQLSSLTLQTYSGTNQLYPLTSSYDVQKEVSHFAKARLSTALITLGQNPYGFERLFQSWPLRPSRKSLRSGLFYDFFSWDQSQAFIIIITHRKKQSIMVLHKNDKFMNILIYFINKMDFLGLKISLFKMLYRVYFYIALFQEFYIADNRIEEYGNLYVRLISFSKLKHLFLIPFFVSFFTIYNLID